MPRFSAEQRAALDEDHRVPQARMRLLSRNSKQVQAPNSGHNVQMDRPDAAIAAIRDAVAAVRSGTRLLAIEASAQSGARTFSSSEFEVASIKPTPPGANGRWIRMLSANEFAAKNHAVKTLIAAAYNLSPQAILGGPAWVESDRYDIVARTPGSVRPSLDEQMSMLRTLLAERFGLAFHREKKEMRVYALGVARGGPKLKESALAADSPPQGPSPLIFVVSPQTIKLPGRYATMGEFASVLQRAALDIPVIDRTGLSGRYDFDLEFTPDETVFGGVLGKGSDDSTTPNLFTAVQQQLGLRLQATKGPVQALVIDQVKRPSEN